MKEYKIGLVAAEFNYEVTMLMIERAKAEAEFLGVKIVKEINKLPLSRKQKNMLYLSRGYSEKDLNSLPWN